METALGVEMEPFGGLAGVLELPQVRVPAAAHGIQKTWSSPLSQLRAAAQELPNDGVQLHAARDDGACQVVFSPKVPALRPALPRCTALKS